MEAQGVGGGEMGVAPERELIPTECTEDTQAADQAADEVQQVGSQGYAQQGEQAQFVPASGAQEAADGAWPAATQNNTSRRWRCIDPTHVEPCSRCGSSCVEPFSDSASAHRGVQENVTRVACDYPMAAGAWCVLGSVWLLLSHSCTPAPSAEEERDYQLVGDPGKRNGEKKLRFALDAFWFLF